MITHQSVLLYLVIFYCVFIPQTEKFFLKKAPICQEQSILAQTQFMFILHRLQDMRTDDTHHRQSVHGCTQCQVTISIHIGIHLE